VCDERLKDSEGGMEGAERRRPREETTSEKREIGGDGNTVGR
jgi:hypothetical protein